MNFITVTLLAIVVTVSTEPLVRYDNFTLYRLTPQNTEHVNILANLENSNSNGYDFWTHAKDIGTPVDVLVSPNIRENMENIINVHKITSEILSENIQEQIDEEKKLNEINFKGTKYGMNWNSYQRLEEIYNWLRSLEKYYPKIVKVIEGGETSEGRKILGVKLSFRKGNEKRGVWIDSLIHAREWISGATNTFILNQLLTSTDPAVKNVAESHDWYFFPVINPDGYEFTHTNNRMWRKTRKSYGQCKGADPNRNWEYKWNKGGASNQPCSDTYAGPKAFSEIETRSLSQYLTKIGHNLIAYISFHSYSQMFLLPYGDTTKHLDNYDQVKKIGVNAMHSLARRYGTKYVVGNVAETIYVATGSSADWVKATFKTPIVVTYELRDKGKHGFILPASEIVPCGLETLDSIITMLQEADELLKNKTIY